MTAGAVIAFATAAVTMWRGPRRDRVAPVGHEDAETTPVAPDRALAEVAA